MMFKKTVAYHDSGVAIHEVEYGVDDKIKWSFYGSKINTSKVRYSDERTYFLAFGNKVYLDECLKTNI